ncbi:MAG: hypothetical protein ACD_2C00260G0002 [uncultured bacterium (gcode 4)]|uniref:Uncharacterized protein n=1 Tax=uncultured bacterium (gcode 4) TaxID=1234023 RepID=K2GF71_9BACT|nr:MAG: hypothetical protein ACD_2C00260G0002 [uncultured bacterium (gcode 4)]
MRSAERPEDRERRWNTQEPFREGFGGGIVREISLFATFNKIAFPTPMPLPYLRQWKYEMRISLMDNDVLYDSWKKIIIFNHLWLISYFCCQK